MLTYAGVHRLQEILTHKLCDTVLYIDHVLVYDISVVFDDGELVLFFDNLPFWRHHVHGGNIQTPLARWGRRMERYVRLVIKLRARRTALSHKQHHHATPQNQRTGKARPAA